MDKMTIKLVIVKVIMMRPDYCENLMLVAAMQWCPVCAKGLIFKISPALPT